MSIALLGLYAFWDNNRLTVVKQDIIMDDLPDSFVGFKILQISDLHEKKFGKDQHRLIKAINQIDYDALIFTGDILDNPESTNNEGFYALLDGIQDKEHLFYVPGNADPQSYQLSPSFGKSEFIKGMEERGVHFLESIDTISKDGESIHFVNFELSIIRKPEQIGNINGTPTSAYFSNTDYQLYQQELWEEMIKTGHLDSSDVLIALNHYPVADPRIDYIKNDPVTEWRDFSLIIAGHYHGGQIRLPFFGALFVPEPWYEPNSLFPPQDRVKGLWQYEQTQQYVSAGLGSSDAIPFFKFRLFNTPEINVLR
ncbi:MAG TPA: metallophosphoesterase, partial [Virgibacillus sp.]|nr:metallophosphoesterase [Virgibacillus sp.]